MESVIKGVREKLAKRGWLAGVSALALLSSQTLAGESAAFADEHWSVISDTAWSGFAQRVIALPDVNGDGVSDLALSVLAERSVQIRSGRTGELLSEFNGPVSFGFELTAVPASKDHDAMLLVGAPLAEVGGLVGGRISLHALPSGDRLWSQSGSVVGERLGSHFTLGSDHIVHVSTHESGRSYSLDTGRELPTTEHARAWLDDALSIGDVDGDGFTDFARSANPASANGWARIWSSLQADPSVAGALLHQFTGVGNDSFGWSLAPAGDLDGDGADDVLIGAPGDDSVATDAGAIHVLSGRTGLPLHVLYGRHADEHLGSALGLLGDINGDGRPEIFLTSYELDDSGSLCTKLSVVSLPDELKHLPSTSQGGSAVRVSEQAAGA